MITSLTRDYKKGKMVDAWGLEKLGKWETESRNTRKHWEVRRNQVKIRA